MEICVLASGSSGNSIFVDSGEEKILVDAGISCRRIQKCLSYLGTSLSEISAVFITHEHIDHVAGLEQLSRRTRIPIFMNSQTHYNLNLNIRQPSYFADGNKVHLNDLGIEPVSISHDAADPCGFKVEYNGKTLGVFTDFGKATSGVIGAVKESDCLVLETNHDVDMLVNGPYPYYLKQRVLSDTGHLSNIDAGLLVKENATEKLKSVFLAHLSKKNNTDELAFNTFSELAGNKLRINSILTSQEKATELVRV